MDVYVDEARHPFRGDMYCHLIADTPEELRAFAMTIGLNPLWIQNEGARTEHFDLSRSKRRLAVEHGAKEIGWREFARILKARAALAGDA